MSLANRFKNTANRLISKYGDDAILTSRSLSSYNTDTGTQPSINTDYAVKAYLGYYRDSDISKGLFGMNDYYALIAFDEPITKAWRLNGDEIINVSTVKSQNKDVIYKLFVRGSNV